MLSCRTTKLFQPNLVSNFPLSRIISILEGVRLVLSIWYYVCVMTVGGHLSRSPGRDTSLLNSDVMSNSPINWRQGDKGGVFIPDLVSD